MDAAVPDFVFALLAHPPVHTLSLHDALPISSPTSFLSAPMRRSVPSKKRWGAWMESPRSQVRSQTDRYASDRKSTRLNSSHVEISYAVFCLKKKTCPGRTASAARWRG